MHLRHLDPILPHLLHQLARVQHAVTPAGLDDPALLLEREILPREPGPDVLLEQGKDLVVADGARVGEVVDARLVVLREQDGTRQQVVQDGVGVGDRADAGVRGDFGDEGTRV